MVASQAGPDDVILIAPDTYAPVFNYYFKGEQPQVAFPQNPGRIERVVWSGWKERWQNAFESVQMTMGYIAANATDDSTIWFLAPMEAYPSDEFFGQVRNLRSLLDSRYRLVSNDNIDPDAPERVDVLMYRLR
jgi:hypothetical protein